MSNGLSTKPKSTIFDVLKETRVLYAELAKKPCHKEIDIIISLVNSKKQREAVSALEELKAKFSNLVQQLVNDLLDKDEEYVATAITQKTLYRYMAEHAQDCPLLSGDNTEESAQMGEYVQMLNTFFERNIADLDPDRHPS